LAPTLHMLAYSWEGSAILPKTSSNSIWNRDRIVFWRGRRAHGNEHLVQHLRKRTPLFLRHRLLGYRRHNGPHWNFDLNLAEGHPPSSILFAPVTGTLPAGDPANRSEIRSNVFLRAARLKFASTRCSVLRGEFRHANATGRNATPRNNSKGRGTEIGREEPKATKMAAAVPEGTCATLRDTLRLNTRRRDAGERP
jgi:hypothetical protein